MNSKIFEYTNKDSSYLKKDIAFRTFFSVLFLAIFVWQFASMVKLALKNSMNIMTIGVSVLVILCSLMMFIISMLYAFKDFRIMAAIKMNGKCVSSVQVLIRTKKRSFIWLYKLLIQILSVATALVLIAVITYSILQVSYYSTVSFYIPLLLLICISGFNSIYHIKDEMHIQNTVQEYHSMY